MDGYAVRAIHPRPERRGFPRKPVNSLLPNAISVVTKTTFADLSTNSLNRKYSRQRDLNRIGLKTGVITYNGSVILSPRGAICVNIIGSF